VQIGKTTFTVQQLLHGQTLTHSDEKRNVIKKFCIKSQLSATNL